MQKLLGGIGGTLLAIYLFGMVASIPYFNWKYAREHGFAAWLFFGEVAATLQAPAWPLFLFRSLSEAQSLTGPVWTQEEKENATHVWAAAELGHRRKALITSESAEVRLSEDQARQLLVLTELELKDVTAVRDDVLEKALPGLRKPFRATYQRSLELTIQSLKTRDPGAAIEAQKLHTEWVDWIDSNGSGIRVPK